MIASAPADLVLVMLDYDDWKLSTPPELEEGGDGHGYADPGLSPTTRRRLEREGRRTIYNLREREARGEVLPLSDDDIDF